MRGVFRKQGNGRIMKISIVIVVCACLASCTLFNEQDLSYDEPSIIKIGSLREIKELPQVDEYGFVGNDEIQKAGKVKRNENLYLILSSLDVSPKKIIDLEKQAKGKFRSDRIRPGQKYFAYLDETSKTLNRVILHQDTQNYIVFDLEDKVSVRKGKKEITSKIQESSGVIHSSLYEALLTAGDDPLLGNKLSDIFGWQIDFFKLYKNDRFKVIYEQEYIGDMPYGIGKVLAAEFTHKGNIFDAFFFESNDRAGYFNSNGNGVQKALLKVPFTYSQPISSGFSHDRFHPVLKTRQPHYGVDYAAPLGTPVISVGDGVVVESRRKGANGNIVQIKHNNTYTTAYLHLAGFARGIKKGAKVKQGQVIGYVGRTGRVTGVHLDYRIYVK